MQNVHTIVHILVNAGIHIKNYCLDIWNRRV